MFKFSFCLYLVDKLRKSDPKFTDELLDKLNKLRLIHCKSLLRAKKLNEAGLLFISNLNIDEFEKLLCDKENAKSDIKWLKFGFPLWLRSYFKGEISVNKLSTKIQNYINTPEEVFAILDKFISEGEKGQILAYTGIIKYCLSIHTVPKKDEFGN